MDKLDKMIILYRLINESKYGVTKGQILEELECSKQTFHRVKELLDLKFHVAVKYDRRTKLYSFDTDNSDVIEMPGLWFKSGEIEALIYLEKLLEDLHNGVISEMIAPFKEKIENVLEAQCISFDDLKHRVKLVSIANCSINTDTLKLTLNATIHQKRLKISYKKIGFEGEERVISPQRLFRYKDKWYLDAFCHLRNGLRTFAVNRIEAVFPMSEIAQIITEDQLEEYHCQSYGIYSGEKTGDALIKFSGNSAEMVAEEIWHKDAVGTWDNDDYYLTIPYGNPNELIMDVLRWGPDATVLEPEELRDRVKSEAEKIIRNYN